MKNNGGRITKPGVGTRILSTLLRYMPKIGPFKGLAFNNPTPKPKIYISRASIQPSISTALFSRKCANDNLVLPNSDLDSGQPTKAAEYSLTDEAYAKLLAQLSETEVRSDLTGTAR